MVNIHNIAADQINSAFVDNINNMREEELQEIIKFIQQQKNMNLNLQDQRLVDSLSQIERIKDFIGNKDHILGSNLTKHGEIAEQVEVGIRNAKDIIEGSQANATFEGVGRTAPEDYLINNMKVQSKFINGTNNTLKHVLDHMDKYQDFGRDGNSLYHIPKNDYELITRIKNGENIEDLNQRTVNAIKDKILKIEEATGRDFNEVVNPSLSDYSEVQQGVVDKTIDKRESNIKDRNEELKKDIEKDAESKQTQAREDYDKPKLNEGLKAGLIGAAVGGSLNLGVSIYKKHKEGKSVYNYTKDDWKEVGIDFGKGSFRGGVSGSSIYALTNYTSMSAPMAAAFVSASFGVASLFKDYNQGKLSFEEFTEQGHILCLETSFVALSGAIGQTLIPIPVVGTIIGSLAGSALMGITKDYIGEKEMKLKLVFEEKYKDALKRIDLAYVSTVEEILKTYRELGDITKLAFDFDMNSKIRFEYSQKLALAHGVEESKILKTISDVDGFMMI